MRLFSYAVAMIAQRTIDVLVEGATNDEDTQRVEQLDLKATVVTIVEENGLADSCFSKAEAKAMEVAKLMMPESSGYRDHAVALEIMWFHAHQEPQTWINQCVMEKQRIPTQAKEDHAQAKDS